MLPSLLVLEQVSLVTTRDNSGSRVESVRQVAPTFTLSSLPTHAGDDERVNDERVNDERNERDSGSDVSTLNGRQRT